MKTIFNWVVYILTWISFIVLLLAVLSILFIVILNQFQSVVGTIFAMLAVIAFITLPFYRRRIA